MGPRPNGRGREEEGRREGRALQALPGLRPISPSLPFLWPRALGAHVVGRYTKTFPPSLGLTLLSSSMTNGETVGEEHPEHEKDEGRRKHDRPVVAQIYIHLIYVYRSWIYGRIAHHDVVRHDLRGASLRGGSGPIGPLC